MNREFGYSNILANYSRILEYSSIMTVLYWLLTVYFCLKIAPIATDHAPYLEPLMRFFRGQTFPPMYSWPVLYTHALKWVKIPLHAHVSFSVPIKIILCITQTKLFNVPEITIGFCSQCKRHPLIAKIDTRRCLWKRNVQRAISKWKVNYSYDGLVNGHWGGWNVSKEM